MAKNYRIKKHHYFGGAAALVIIILFAFNLIPGISSSAGGVKISNIQTFNITSLSAEITLTANAPGNVMYCYGSTKKNEQCYSQQTFGTKHYLLLDNLKPATKYTVSLSLYPYPYTSRATQATPFSFTTLPASSDVTAPSTPAGFSTKVVSPTQVDLQWSASTDNVGVKGYRIYRWQYPIGSTEGTTFSDANLLDTSGNLISDTQYAITAYDAAGNPSSKSITLRVVTNDTVAPSVPTNLTAQALSNSQIRVSWVPSTDNVAVAGYNVYRDGTYLASPRGSSFTDTGLTATTAYTYKVSAFDSMGNASTQSQPIVVTTLSMSTTTATTTAPTATTTTP